MGLVLREKEGPAECVEGRLAIDRARSRTGSESRLFREGARPVEAAAAEETRGGRQGRLGA